MEHSAFITTTSGGDLVVVSGRQRYFLARESFQAFLCPDRTTLLCGRSSEPPPAISFVAGENLVLFTLPGRMFFIPWPEFLEVIGRDVQWASLQLVSGRWRL